MWTGSGVSIEAMLSASDGTTAVVAAAILRGAFTEALRTVRVVRA
jgi:hypothetical protein